MNLTLMNIMPLIAGADGLGNLQTNLVKNWIGPLFFIVVAALSIKFIISRQFRELAGFLGIAAVVGLLVFNATGLFSQSGIFYGIANGFTTLLKGGGGTAAGGGMIEIVNFITNIL